MYIACVALKSKFQSVAHKCWTFGNGLRESEDPDAQPSIWLQKGLELLVRAEAKGATPGMHELQVSHASFKADRRLPSFGLLVWIPLDPRRSAHHSSSRAGEEDTGPCQPRPGNECTGEAD